MDGLTELFRDAVYFRGFERILLTLGGFTSIVLGGLLFKWGILDKTTIEVDKTAMSPGITLRNASPGVIFCLFGAYIISVGFNQQLAIKQEAAAFRESLASDTVGKSTNANHNPVFSITYSTDDKANLVKFLKKLQSSEKLPTEDEFKNIKDTAARYAASLEKLDTKSPGNHK